MSRILLIEDDVTLGATLQERLERENYLVTWAEDLQKGKQSLHNNVYDLIILDVKLPDGSGFDLAKSIKKSVSTPLIFVSALTSAPYRLQGYELGAEEYIPKPFHLKELLLRVRHVLLNHAQPKKIRCGSKIIDFHRRSISDETGRSEFLAIKDFQILKLLIEVSPRVVSRDEILNEVWGEENYPSTRTVDNVIVRLRNLLEDDKNTFIRSVRGVGYQWVGEKE